jgi:hypothetical protein
VQHGAPDREGEHSTGYENRVDVLGAGGLVEVVEEGALGEYQRAEGVLLLPFGGHPVTYAPQDGEDRRGAAASWQHDGEVSQPRPTESAAWWGLLRLPLRALTTPALLGAAAPRRCRRIGSHLDVPSQMSARRLEVCALIWSGFVPSDWSAWPCSCIRQARRRGRSSMRSTLRTVRSAPQTLV